MAERSRSALRGGVSSLPPAGPRDPPGPRDRPGDLFVRAPREPGYNVRPDAEAPVDRARAALHPAARGGRVRPGARVRLFVAVAAPGPHAGGAVREGTASSAR